MKCDLKDCKHNLNGICCKLSYLDCLYYKEIVCSKVKRDIENWEDYKKEAYNEMFVSAHSEKLILKKYTIEQIVDAIIQANEVVIHAIEQKDIEMLKNTLREYLH